MRHPRAFALALAGVLLAAAALRFAGLGWGLRHTPVLDEQDFVENAGQMIRHSDWNHRFYVYPGLFLDVLRIVLPLAPPSTPYHSSWAGFPSSTAFGPTGYLAARSVVAACGVASVALVACLGAGLLGPQAGIVAGLLLALSPLEVVVAHEVRPDVVLETFVLLALLSFRRLGAATRDDVLAGVALGAAASVKFTGAALMPAYLSARLLSPGPRLRGVCAAGVAAALVFVITTPYALLAWRGFLGGIFLQAGFHYRDHALFSRFGECLLFYVLTLAWSLGPAGGLMALAGLCTLRPRVRAFLPILSYLLVLLIVLSSAHVHWHRLLVSALGIGALVAAAGFEALRPRAPRLAWSLVLAAAAPLAYVSARALPHFTTPDARDRAAAWVDANLPDGSRVLTSVHEIGLDARRFDVVGESGSAPLDRLLARQSDLVIWHAEDHAPVEGFEEVWRGEPLPWTGLFGQEPEVSLRSLQMPILLFRPSAPLRLTYSDVPLGKATVRASSNGDDARLAIDGRVETGWKTDSAQASTDWFEARLPQPALLGRVELVLGDRPLQYGRALRLEVVDGGGGWAPVRFVEGRSPAERQISAGRADVRQLLVFEPVRTSGVRLRPGTWVDRRWGFAELRLGTPNDGAGSTQGDALLNNPSGSLQ